MNFQEYLKFERLGSKTAASKLKDKKKPKAYNNNNESDFSFSNSSLD